MGTAATAARAGDQQSSSSTNTNTSDSQSSTSHQARSTTVTPSTVSIWDLCASIKHRSNTTTTTTLNEIAYARCRCFFAVKLTTVKIDHAGNIFSMVKILSVRILTTWKVADHLPYNDLVNRISWNLRTLDR